MTATQIANFFLRLASKKTFLDDNLGEQFLDEEDEEAAAVEDELEQMTTEAANEQTAKHPLFYDNYNLRAVIQRETRQFCSPRPQGYV